MCKNCRNGNGTKEDIVPLLIQRGRFHLHLHTCIPAEKLVKHRGWEHIREKNVKLKTIDRTLETTERSVSAYRWVTYLRKIVDGRRFWAIAAEGRDCVNKRKSKKGTHIYVFKTRAKCKSSERSYDMERDNVCEDSNVVMFGYLPNIKGCFKRCSVYVVKRNTSGDFSFIKKFPSVSSPFENGKVERERYCISVIVKL